MATLEELELNGFTTVGNIYVDSTWTATSTPATNEITGEAMTFGTNAFAALSGGTTTPAYPEDGSALFVTNVNVGGNRIWNGRNNSTLYDLYVNNVQSGDIYIMPRNAGTYHPDTDGTLNVYIEGTSIASGGYHGFAATTNANFTGDYVLTIKNTRMQYMAVATGSAWGMDNGDAGNHRYAKVDGNITFTLDNLTVDSVAGVARGQVGTNLNQAKITGTITNSKFGQTFQIIHTGVDSSGNSFNSYVDIDITVTGSSFSGAWMTLPNQSSASRNDRGELTTHGDIKLKIAGSTMNGLVIGAGRNGTGWRRVGWIDGNIEFELVGSTTALTFINKGYVGTTAQSRTVTGTISANSVVGDLVAYELRGDKGDFVRAASNLTVSESTIGNFTFLTTINSGGTTTSVGDKAYGAQVLNLAGATTGNIATGAATHKDATFSLNFQASEKQGASGSITGQWSTITVDAGAKVRVNSISVGEGATLNIAVGSAFSTPDLGGIATINVTGDLPTGDTIIISGLSISELAEGTKVMVGETEFSYGLFGGQYSITSKGDLVVHNGDTYLVNENYTDGQKTDLGPKGYSSFKKAQDAITDPTKTTITVYGLDPDNLGNSLNEDITTKNYTVTFVSDDTNLIEFNDHNLLIGDSTAVDSVSLNVSYTTNINTVTFGNITNKAEVSFEASQIGNLNLTAATVGDAELSFNEVEIENLYLANNAEFVGTLTVANSTITNVYGAASGLTVDMTGSNTITNVYAEGTGSAIQLGTSEVGTFVAGYKDAKSITTFEYEGGVNANELILGGDSERNTIGTMKATLNKGEVGVLRIGGTNDVITGNVDLTFDGGDFSAVSFAEIGGNLNATLRGGHFSEFDVQNVAGKTTVTLAGGTVANAPDGTFYGLVYGASISGMLNGGNTGTDLIVDGNAKVESVSGFTALNVLGGTLNVAGGDKKSEVNDSNTLEIDGDIMNRRGINAGAITAVNLTNYGLIGVYRENASDAGINLSGNLVNASYIKTANLTVEGNFTNTGKITSVGDITVEGSFDNSGEIYFRSAFSQDGEFSQEGGLVLNDINVTNTGFISAATLTGVKNLTTSKMYITGGAEITGNLTITAGAEVAFTNKANVGIENGLALGGSITMYDTSALIVSGELTTDGTKTITVNCGDLIGYNEIVRAESGVNEWTIKLAGTGASKYEYVQDEVSVLIYSTDEVFVNASYSEDETNYFNGNKLLYGKNAFATVAEAVAGAKAGAKIRVLGDISGADIAAANFDVILDGAKNVGSVTAKTLKVVADSDVKSIVAAGGLTINASALLSVAETLPTALPITIDASAGAGSRLVLDVDPLFQTLTESQVTVISPSGKSYAKRILAGTGDHAGDLYIVSNDKYAYYVPSLYKTENETLVPTFADGEAFDRATGDALFANVNAFGDKDQAIQAAKDIKGIFVLVGDVVENAVGEADVQTMIEVDRARGDSGQSRAIVGIHDDGSTMYVSDQDHTTIIAGSTSTGNVYGLTRWYDMSGDYTLIVQDSVSTGSALWITGNNYDNVTNGDITAVITGSTFQNVYLGAGSFGTDETKPINIDVTIRDSRISGFYGIHTERGNNDPANRQDINANFTVRIYDSYIDGGTVTFLNTNNDNYSGTDVTQLQTYYTAGSITLELGGVNMPDGNIRIGGSLEVSGKAMQAFNVPITVHVVATENSTVTHCDWVCDVDTLIVDATAQLLIDNALQYTTVDKDSANAIDNGGTPTQVMINMSGYKSGTHNVIQANYNPTWGGTRGIYTDNNLSNITVIGDNDLTGQCELAYLTQTRDGDTYLNAVYVFDKSDDMFVNPDYTDAINGTSDSVTEQEFLLNYNAHTDFDRAFFYANDWGGTITVTGGEWGDIDFQGNDVAIRKGASFDSVTMAESFSAWDAATLTVENGVKIGVIDGSKDNVDSTLLVEDDTDFAVVKDFESVVVVDATATFESLSGSNLSITASSMIEAAELDLTGSSITIDVTGYVGRPHVVVSAEDDIVGFDASNVTIEGENKDKFSLIQVENNLVLTTTIPSDTFLNNTYTEATTGTILEDGTYLEYGFNAFADSASAIAGLGSRSNTLTVTGGDIAGDLVMNGANFVLSGGALQGIVYATWEKDYRNMTITVGNGSVGGIEMTAQEGSYAVTRASITLADGAVVSGAVVGAGDTTVTVTGNAVIGQTLENIKTLVIDANACITASSIEMVEGGTIKVTGIPAIAGTNMHKVISTTGGYSVKATADAGIYLYEQGNDLFVLDLGRIYYSSDYSAEITGSTLANGDVLFYGINAFSNLNDARTTANANKGMVYVLNRNGNLALTGTPVANLAIIDSTVSELSHGLTGNQTYNGDVHVVIKNSVISNNNSYVMGQGAWNSRNTLAGTFTLDVTDSVIRDNFRVGTHFNAGNKTYVLNFTDTEIRGDLAIISDSPFNATDSVTVNMTGVTAPVTKWWTFFDGYPNEDGGTINLNIKDSVLGDGGNGFRFALQRDNGNSNQFHHFRFNVSVENTTVNGGILAEHIAGQNITFTDDDIATLNVIGDNSIRYVLQFNKVNIGADASITGSTLSMREGGEINIDATGYTGPTKSFIYMSTLLNGAITVTGVDEDLYDLVITENAVIVFDGTIGNIYWNPNYTINSSGLTTAYGDVLIAKGAIEDDPEIANAFSDLEEAKLALQPGYKLIVTAVGEDGKFFGTLESEEVTENDINVVIAGGNFSAEGSIIAAADLANEKVFLGNSTIEIAGGTYGVAAVVDADGNTTSDAIFTEINGTREVAGGTSGLLVTYNAGAMYANLIDFDYLTVQGNVQVMGDIATVNALYIDCNGSLSVAGTLDADSVENILLTSKDYTGPSKIVLHSESLSPEAVANMNITVDGSEEDRWYYDGKSDIWLVSNDPSNVYLDSSFTEDINGTTVGGDLLFYGINAVSTMEEAVMKTTSDYRLTVMGGVFDGEYSLASIGTSNVYVDGGTINSLTVGNTDGANLSRVELTGATSKANIGTLTGDEKGVRLIMDKDAKVGTVNNAQYIRIGLDQGNVLSEVNYIAEGGRLVLDLSGFTGHEGNVLSVAGGINNFLVPVAGETYSLATIEVTNDATKAYGFYYDPESKNIVAVKLDSNVFMNANASAEMNGTKIGDTTLAYGFNLSRNNAAAAYALEGATLYVEGLINQNLRTDTNTNAEITQSYLTDVRLGPTSGTNRRTGDFTLDVIGSTFGGGNQYLAGRGSDGNNRATFIVGTQESEEAAIVDGVWNLTFRALKDEEGKIIARSGHENNGGNYQFKVTENVNIAGGTVNLVFEDYNLNGDMFLFDNAYDVTVGEDKLSLNEINVTMTNVNCPAAKWIWFWDPREDNATTINMTITDSTFVGDTMGFGIFGTDTSNWTGEANVTISGVTVNGGTFSGGKGANGDDNGVNGVRTLNVLGTNSFNVLKQFTNIVLEADASLSANEIIMAGGTNSGFILRGEAGYTGGAKEFIVATNGVSGVEQTAAQFLDAEGKEIAGYVAVVGATNVFIYTQDGAIYYGNGYTTAINGTAVEDALTGKKNFLALGDNAVATMAEAYTNADTREKQLIVVQQASDNALYAKGYKMILNGGNITTFYGSAEEGAVAALDVTINAGIAVNSVVVATEGSTITGDALITVGDGATLGNLDGANDYVNGTSSIVFTGDATAFSIANFNSVTIQANNEVTLSRTFTGKSLTIDVTGFTGASKRVMTVNGGEIPDDLVISAGTYTTEWLDGKTLVLVSDTITDVYVNTQWTEADVTNKFEGDMLLVWNKNAFNNIAGGAAVVGKDSTLYVAGDFQTTDALALSNANVILQGATVGLGAVTASDTVLTIASKQFTAASLSGVAELSVLADAVTISGGIAMSGDGKLTIDVTGHTQTVNDVVVLSTESGITGLADEITVIGEGANKYYAYYDETDGDVHMLSINNLYVDIGFGTAGELIPEGATNPITHEPYVFGANAFYSLTEALGRLSNGMGLYINARPYDVRTNDKLSDLYLTNSDIPVLINGYTSGDQTFTGDVTVNIIDSTVGRGGNSTLVAKTTVDEPWNHLNTINGNVLVNVDGSTLGSATDARTINGTDYVRVSNGNFTFNVTDSVLYANLEIIGDSPIANNEIVSVNFKNVTAPVDRNIWITDGNQNNAGTINVTLDNVNLGAGDMQVATQSDWNYGDRNSSNKVTFNVSNTTIGGSLSADCIGREELTGYTGAKVLNVTGDNTIGQVLWFKNINIDATATLTADAISMSTASAKVVVDATAFSGKSHVIVSAKDGITGLTDADVSVLVTEGAPYEVFTDYNAETKTMSAIVIKGDLKDIYANEDYTLEELPFGTTYNGEALFCGFNAFDSAADALAALTVEGASLYVTGSLSYESPDAPQVITVNGSLVNDGTFKISAKGFVDGSQSDVTILTATSISGNGRYTTDNAAYTVTVVDNTLHLVLKKVDVYVSTAWAELEDGSIVEIPGGTATLGTDAFATADAAASKVSANGTITVLASDVKFSSAIVRTVTATSGSTIQNANIGTANGAGSLTLESGAVATNAQVRNGTLTVSDGAKVTGGLKITDGAVVTFGANTALDLDISAMTVTDTAVMTGYSIMTGSPAISITIAADQADGTYAIATDAASFGTQAVTLKTVAATITSDLTLGNTQTIEGIEYTLALDDNNVLTLTKHVYEEPITVTYVNPAWAAYEDGTVVPVTGGTAIVGKDAFADADLATEKVISTGIVKVTAGTVTFANGITKQTQILSGAELTNTNVNSVLTVDAGATLTGKAVFGEGASVTINGTVIFDLSLAIEGAQFTGFAVAGDAQYKLIGESAVGDYTLATGVSAFTSLTVGDQTLEVGKSIIVGDAFEYSLALNEGTLALNIASYTPPVVIPTITYVNSAWATKTAGAVIPVEGGTAIYMTDAFSTGDEAIAAVSEDGEVKVLGGTVSFTDAIAKAVTISADATLFGKATFGVAITIDGTVAFDTALTADGAQITGLSKVTGATKYTLTAAAVEGTYTLATDAAGFNSEVAFNGQVLTVGAEAITIDNFSYKLGITDNNELNLIVKDVTPEPPTPTKEFVAGSDIDGNGISDVMFVWTGNNYQHGYWMNGTSDWQSVGVGHPAEWENLGCYDMAGDGKADAVLVGNVVVGGVKGAYIGYYADANDADANWVNIGYLNNADDIAWQNKVGNLTGNEQGANSIVWFAPELAALGVWTDGTENWVSVTNTFNQDWTLIGCGDFNGDGKDSILMSGVNGQYLYTADIDGTVASLGNANWSGWEVRAIGDFLGDGKDDMVLFHLETGSMVMCADGNIDDFKSLDQLDAVDWFVVGAGDYNNDQKDDLLVRQYSTGMLGYYVSGDTQQWVELGRGVDMNWTVIA